MAEFSFSKSLLGNKKRGALTGSHVAYGLFVLICCWAGHGSVPADVRKALMDKYKHPIHKELEETAKKVGGHGGMDFIMDYRLAYCLQNGLPLDMDVYDLAEWCCMAELTRLSIENNSAPVEVPDFTRGGWNKVKGYRHAFAK